MISRRDATDRVACAEEDGDLGDLLGQAMRGGDETLARAVVERAVQRGNEALVNVYLAPQPDSVGESASRLWKGARREESSQGFGMTTQLLSLRLSFAGVFQ